MMLLPTLGTTRRQQPVLPDPRKTPVLKVDQAAELLGISRQSAYDAVRSGELPAFRIGKRVLVPTARLLELLGLDAA
jgi:excisionase family DNA binding protein